METQPREETILIVATMQPAEPAARPVMAVAHWLTDRSMLTQRLLDRFRFCFIPVPNPDYDPSKESWVGSRNYDLSIDPRWVYFPES